MSGVNNLRHWCYLHDMPELEPLIAQWFLQEWPSHYGPLGKGDVWQDIATYRHREGTGMGIIAFEANKPCGFIALKNDKFLPETRHFHGSVPLLLSQKNEIRDSDSIYLNNLSCSLINNNTPKFFVRQPLRITYSSAVGGSCL